MTAIARRIVAILALAASLAWCCGALWAESVDISVPASFGFSVYDVTASTSGGVTALTYSNAHLSAGQRLQISIQADNANLIPPSGPTSIPVGKVSWTTSNAVGGAGSSGTLSATGFVVVYRSNPDPGAGSVDMTWTLAAPGSGIRAGSHTLGVHWRIESVP